MAYLRRIPKDEKQKATGWEAHVTLGRTPGGKKIRRSKTFRRKSDAEKWATDQEAEGLPGGGRKASAGAFAAGKGTVAAWLETWLDKLDAMKSPGRRTRHDYRSVLRRYVLEAPEGAPPIGQQRLADLRAAQVEALYVWMRDGQGLSRRTIQGLHAVLRKAMNDAVRQKVLAVSPVKGATIPKAEAAAGDAEAADEARCRSMTREEARAFLEAAREDRFHALWAVLLATGLRPSEAFALRWKDLDGDTLQVRGALSRRGVKEAPGWVRNEPKTTGSRRNVPLPAWALEAVKAWRKVQAADQLKAGEGWEDHGFIFTTTTGAPLDHSNLRRRHFNPILRRAGLGRPASERKGARWIPGFTPYDLRHTCASLLIQAAVPINVVQERLGHSTIKMTMDTYGHVLPGMQEAATREMDALLGEGTGG